jgi:hypothetical protein
MAVTQDHYELSKGNRLQSAEMNSLYEMRVFGNRRARWNLTDRSARYQHV